jgi:mediator of RNA polymerase II transcription subunit 21
MAVGGQMDVDPIKAEGVREGGFQATNSKSDDVEASSSTSKSASLDLISQLESDLALMLQIMSSSLHFIATRSAHVQLNDDIPLFQALTNASASASRQLLSPEAMAEEIEELTDDLVGKAKEMEKLIQSIPCKRDESVVMKELKEIDEEMVEANKDFIEALEEVSRLRSDIDSLLRALCDDHRAGRARLAASVAAQERKKRQK